MMHLCITQCTYWTPLYTIQSFYQSTEIVKAASPTSRLYRTWNIVIPEDELLSMLLRISLGLDRALAANDDKEAPDDDTFSRIVEELCVNEGEVPR